MADPQHGWTPVDESAWTDVAPPPMDPKTSLAYQRAHAGDVLTEGPDAPPSGLMGALSHAAYPQSAGDFASLLIPQGASTAIGAGGAMLRKLPSLRGPVGSAMETVGEVAMHPWEVPGRLLRAAGRQVKPAFYQAETAPHRPPIAPSIVDEAGASLGGYAGPERRVSDLGRASRRDPHDQLLERLGGRATTPPDAARELAQKLGQPGDAEMAMAVSHRNTTGNWAPPASTVRAPVSLNEAMDAAVKAQQARAALLAQLAKK